VHHWTKRSKRGRDGTRLEHEWPGTWKVVRSSHRDEPLFQLEFELSPETRSRVDELNNRFVPRVESESEEFNPQKDAAISGDGTTIVTLAGERAPAVWKVGTARPIRSLGEEGKSYARQVTLDGSG